MGGGSYGGGSGMGGDSYGGGSGTGGDSYGGGRSGRDYDDDNQGSGKQKDSTMGKMMEKAGGMFKSDKMEEKGAEKRREAGGYEGGRSDDY